MISLATKNAERFLLADIPVLGRDAFCASVTEGLSEGMRLISLFPLRDDAPEKLAAVLAETSSAGLHIVAGDFSGRMELESFTPRFPHANYLECELAERHGYTIHAHPRLRPVRSRTFPGGAAYDPCRLEGDEVHEVAVGPIHAGVIEPGHFRFQCHGELVYSLEILLGYQHRGIEALFAGASPEKRVLLAESIAGDTAVGHAYAHCKAIEHLSGAHLPFRAQIIRSIAEELERIAMHLSGLIGVSNDIGLAIGASSYGRLRTLVINSLAELCGSRFGRGLFVYGGVRFDVSRETAGRVIEKLETVRRDVTEINDFLFSSTGALLRFEHTGVVTKETAAQIGMVGFAARASGVEMDTRTHRPYGAYRYFPVPLLTIGSGDVFSRSRLRAMEIDESLRFVFEQLENLPGGEFRVPVPPISPGSGAVSLVEGWRGEIVHSVFTDESGGIMQYRVKDPSFCNWWGLSMALRKTAISDFPVCNKSFDLSYAGHDL